MAKLNFKTSNPDLRARTHGGALAASIGPVAKLRRAVMSTLLFEDQFYEDGVDQMARIRDLALKVDPEALADIAIEARRDHGLRHVPLLLLVLLAKTGSGVPHLVSETITKVCTRADQLTDLLALYRSEGNAKFSAQLKKGIARALENLDTYQMSKYAASTGKAFALRDALFISHARSLDGRLAADFDALANNRLRQLDTWERASSAKVDMKDEFTRLLSEGKLGYLALLRNLRRFEELGLARSAVVDAIKARRGARSVWPTQFYAAAKASPAFADAIQDAMLANVRSWNRLSGRTVIVADISGSMTGALSAKSEFSRYDATALLTGCLVEQCDDPVVYATAGSDGRRLHATKKVSATPGFRMIETLKAANVELGHGGIFLTQCMDYIHEHEDKVDRVIVLTDEQDIDSKRSPLGARMVGDRNYLINVASHQHGIGYKNWIHVDGFSEGVLRWIAAYEAEQEAENAQ
jgi:hypothetical protein